MMPYRNDRTTQEQEAAQRKMLEEALDHAIEKWLDKQFSTFGKWTLRGVAAVAFAALAWAYFHTGGFKS